MRASRYLIVNADDFGQSPGVNRGIVAAHERGIVTSASLMVRWPAAAEAAAYARGRPELSVGLHLDLGEWVCRNGSWQPRYEVVSVEDATAVAEEVTRQLAAFRRLLGTDPTHLDSHQHVHAQEPVRTVLRELARRLGGPVRHDTPGIRYCGRFYGQMADGAPLPEEIGVQRLLRLLAELPRGCTELACHPGEGDDLDSTYLRERSQEVRTLCDPCVRAAVDAAGIRLVSFRSPVIARIRSGTGEGVGCAS
jgi:predicted glycoside hydrolase/deacetylase ChbG (UPF0249 family)